MNIDELIDGTQRLRTLRGETCTRARISYASTLMLNFGEHGNGNAGGSARLVLIAGCPWRLETRERFITGAGDVDEIAIPAIQCCVGQRFERARIFQPSYTVEMQFDGELVLWLFPCDSTKYDQQKSYSDSPWIVTGSAFPDGTG